MSIFIQYDNWGRVGNRMFQLAFGYLLAKQKNVKLYHTGLPNFDIHPSVLGVNPVDPIYTRSYGDNYVDMCELLETNRDIVVDSFVQKAEYYTPFKQDLKTFFNVRPFTINNDKLVIHIRETDYKLINQFLGYKVYRQLIDKSGFKNVIPRLGKPNGKPYTNQEDFQKHIQTLLEVASRLCQVVFVGMVPVDESKMPFAGCLYYNHLDQSIYSEITKQACRERDIPYLDLFRNSPTIELSNDGLHPNPAGHIKILEQVCNWGPIKQLSSQSAKL